MSTPTPRTSAAIIASGFQAVPEGFRAFAGILERELAAVTAERDQLRSDCENETKWAAHYLAQSIADKARAERSEADLAALGQSFDDNCRGVVKIADELTVERARLDWLESPAGMDWQWQAGITRATIDAKMQKDAK